MGTLDCLPCLALAIGWRLGRLNSSEHSLQDMDGDGITAGNDIRKQLDGKSSHLLYRLRFPFRPPPFRHK
jgi:hypothetical protein